jgi:hypothetical protein
MMALNLRDSCRFIAKAVSLGRVLDSTLFRAATPSKHTYRMDRGLYLSDVSFPRVSDKQDNFSATYSPPNRDSAKLGYRLRSAPSASFCTGAFRVCLQYFRNSQCLCGVATPLAILIITFPYFS